ncbi:MAG: hypothetical protein AAB798_03040 [Patescibacteria group bacterium]
MNMVTLPEYEYKNLAFQAGAYRAIAKTFADVQTDRAVVDVVARFAATKKYSKAFLHDFEEGLTDLRKSK